MFGLGATEVMVIGFIALLIFGPGSLAKAARSMGAMLGKAQSKLDEASTELMSADYPDEWFEAHGQQAEDLFDERPGG